MPSLLASVIDGKPNEDDTDEETGATPDKASESKPPESKPSVVRLPDSKVADAAARVRSGASATFQLASADAQLVTPAKPPNPDAAVASAAPSSTSETGPQTPADIINARGFWG